MKKVTFSFLASAALIVSFAGTALSSEVVVYSARNEHLIEPLFEEFTDQTGIKVRFITDKAGALVQRLKTEGSRSPADVLITVDAGNLWYAADQDLLQPVTSEILSKNIPDHLRDPEGRWFGLSIRARTIVYNTEKVKPEELSTYAALGDSNWRGRLLLRTSKKVYNQSLVAMLISEHGVDKTEGIVSSWVDNLAADPFSNDTKVMEAIAAGQGDVGVVNSYYFGRLMKKKPDLPLALFWPGQSGSGVHVNISGAGITTYATHKNEAIRFLEWLSSPPAQRVFADSNMEYPVNSAVEPNLTVKSWGAFKQNTMNLAKAGQLQSASIMLMDRVGYR